MLLLYSLGHFAVDFVCAWLVLGRAAGTAEWLWACLLYNFCAFALQLPVGILSDRLGRCRLFSALGAGLVLLALLPLGSLYTVLLAGLGNAFYHVGGGRETLLTEPGYGPLGIFVAPGALGIFLGGAFRGQTVPGLFGMLLLIFSGVLLFLYSREEKPSSMELGMDSIRALLRLFLLFLVVLLRSLVGLCGETAWRTGLWIVLGAVLGAAGKALGGLSADRLGGKRAGAASLLLAAALFLFPASPVCGILAGLLFNMSMPITLRDAAAGIRGGEGMVFGLMTFGLFLGFLPALYGFTIRASAAAALSALSGLLLVLCAGGEACSC